MTELSSAIGISRPTLSKFFQNSYSVRDSTRERIEQALHTVDYVPNFFATKMNRDSTRIIGVIVPYLNDLFFTSLIQSIEEAALQQGYTIAIQCAHGDPALEVKAFENLMYKNIDFIGTNNQQSVSLMVAYLHRSGSSPVYLGMPRINSNSIEREQAYIRSAEDLGFEPQIIPLDNSNLVWKFEEYAYDTMDEYFARGEFVNSTILCANDRLAIGVIRAANRHHLWTNSDGQSSGHSAGHRSGHATQFRVAGHDDHPLAAYMNPALTTVSRNTECIGKAAVEQILDQIVNGKRSGNGMIRTFDAELRLRESA